MTTWEMQRCEGSWSDLDVGVANQFFSVGNARFESQGCCLLIHPGLENLSMTQFGKNYSMNGLIFSTLRIFQRYQIYCS